MAHKEHTEHKEHKDCSHKPRFTLGYWKIRGLAQPARMMLAYGACKFNDVVYEQGDAPEYSRAKWFDVKFTLDLDFPNIPYLIDHKQDLRITESHAIYRYLGRELKIGSTVSQERAYEEMVGDLFKDLFNKWTGLCYSRDFESTKSAYVKQLPESIQLLEKYLKGNRSPRKWLGGQDLCYSDFMLFEFIDQTSKLCPEVYESFPELTRFYKAFKELKPLQDFFKSEAAKYPLNNKSAQFK